MKNFVLHREEISPAGPGPVQDLRQSRRAGTEYAQAIVRRRMSLSVRKGLATQCVVPRDPALQLRLRGSVQAVVVTELVMEKNGTAAFLLQGKKEYGLLPQAGAGYENRSR